MELFAGAKSKIDQGKQNPHVEEGQVNGAFTEMESLDPGQEDGSL